MEHDVLRFGTREKGKSWPAICIGAPVLLSSACARVHEPTTVFLSVPRTVFHKEYDGGKDKVSKSPVPFPAWAANNHRAPRLWLSMANELLLFNQIKLDQHVDDVPIYLGCRNRERIRRIASSGEGNDQKTTFSGFEPGTPCLRTNRAVHFRVLPTSPTCSRHQTTPRQFVFTDVPVISRERGFSP